LKATVAPANATNKKVKWSSSNTKVATVTAGGVVAAKGAGKARIYAVSVDGNKRTSMVVTVKVPIDPHCAWTGASRAVLFSLGAQRAYFCSGKHLVRASAVTTGASAYGYGTPTGVYRIVNKVRNTALYPSTGGVYPVKYWMPFIGNVYGIHDSPWQTIPYGSQAYKTQGSHGCIHLPPATIAWFFGWAPIGTIIRITV